MATRIITISSCNDCPHRNHRGAFGKPAYVPRCSKTNRTLPYRTGVAFDRVHLEAHYTGEIPSWCPLEKKEG